MTIIFYILKKLIIGFKLKKLKHLIIFKNINRFNFSSGERKNLLKLVNRF
jgi:hypothetical protein